MKKVICIDMGGNTSIKEGNVYLVKDFSNNFYDVYEEITGSLGFVGKYYKRRFKDCDENNYKVDLI